MLFVEKVESKIFMTYPRNTEAPLKIISYLVAKLLYNSKFPPVLLHETEWGKREFLSGYLRWRSYLFEDLS